MPSIRRGRCWVSGEGRSPSLPGDATPIPAGRQARKSLILLILLRQVKMSQYPARGDLIPARGDLIPTRGGLIPTRGGLIPDRDGLIPDRDGLAPSGDDLRPKRGGLAPTGAASPPGGAAFAQRGVASPQRGATFPLSGAAFPRAHRLVALREPVPSPRQPGSTGRRRTLSEGPPPRPLSRERERRDRLYFDSGSRLRPGFRTCVMVDSPLSVGYLGSAAARRASKASRRALSSRFSSRRV